MPRSPRRSCSERVAAPRGVVAALAALLAIAPAGSWRAAHADPDDPSAAVAAYKEAITAGSELFASGDFAAARSQFERAYAIHADPVLIFNIASTYRRQQQHEQALRLYKRFLSLVPPDDARAVLARETVEHLEGLVARSEEPAAERSTPERADLHEAALPPSLASQQAAGSRAVDLWAPTPVRDEPSGRGLRTIGVGTAAIGAAGLGLAAADALRARRTEQQIEALPAGTPWAQEHADLYRRGEAAQRRAAAFAIAGSALVATGVVVYVVGARSERRATGALTVAPTAGGGALVLSGGF